MFDSKREAQRYVELKQMAKAGAIEGLILQPRFELQPAYKKNGENKRKIEYVADFMYTQNGETVVEDVKGVRTPVYKMKKKIFEYVYSNLTITEI